MGNTFGHIFRITTWGESHGKAVGVVIDGCPAGLELNEEILHRDLKRRAPGRSPDTSPRKESDLAEIYSGVFEGKTTGAPISIVIPNRDVNSSHYEAMREILRPGHANYTYLKKYGIFDHRGSGRASARETVCRVAAGAVAKQLLLQEEIKMKGEVELGGDIEAAKREGDSIGGIVKITVTNVPTGLGEPIYRKLEALLGHAMLTIPASKGFEIGSGFRAPYMRGSEHNDAFLPDGTTETNHAGGTLGGISTGMPLIFSVPFKPTASVRKAQKTTTVCGKETTLHLPKGSRHDPCTAIRALPVVEAMCALVLADTLLMDRCTTTNQS